MDQKQKKELNILLKARKRAEKVLAEQREVEQKKEDYKRRKEINQELAKQYTQELTAQAQESGILALAEQSALERGGYLTQKPSFYIDYGASSSCGLNSLVTADQGKLRPAYLALHIIWGTPGMQKEVEIQITKNGQISFHNFIVPVFPFIWRRYPQLLQKMLSNALEHPRQVSEPVKKAA